MTREDLRRIKVSSLDQLRTWVSANVNQRRDVMIVTNSKPNSRHYISSAQVRAVLSDFGWQAGPSSTLKGGLMEHVARPNHAPIQSKSQPL